MSAEAGSPAVEAGDDPRVARDLVPPRRLRPDLGAQERGEGHGGEGQELHHRGAQETAAAEEEEERSGEAAAPEGERRMELEGDAQALEEVGEEGSVAIGARKDHPHLLEGHAPSGFSQQPAREGPHLARLAGSGHELDPLVSRRPAPGGLEELRPKAEEGRRRRGRSERSQHRLLPRDLRDPVLARPGAERRRLQGRRARRGGAAGRGSGGPPRPGTPSRARRARGPRPRGRPLPGARRRGAARPRRRAGPCPDRPRAPPGWPRTGGRVGREPAGASGPPARPRRGRRAPRCARGDAGLAQVLERAGEGGRHGPAGHVRREAQPLALVLAEETRGEASVVAGVPGRESASQQLRLRHRPREVQHARAVVIPAGLREPIEGHGPTRRGEAPRQLHRGRHRGRDEDDGVHGRVPRNEAVDVVGGPAVGLAWSLASGARKSGEGGQRGRRNRGIGAGNHQERRPLRSPLLDGGSARRRRRSPSPRAARAAPARRRRSRPGVSPEASGSGSRASPP